MKSMKYLSMKDDRDQVLTSHSSCIISEDFVAKYLNVTDKDKQLKERKEELNKEKDISEAKKIRLEKKKAARNRSAKKGKKKGGVNIAKANLGRGHSVNAKPGYDTGRNIGKAVLGEDEEFFDGEEYVENSGRSSEEYSDENSEEESYYSGEDSESEENSDEEESSDDERAFSGGESAEEQKESNDRSYTSENQQDKNKAIHLSDVSLEDKDNLKLRNMAPTKSNKDNAKKRKFDAEWDQYKAEKAELDKKYKMLEKETRINYENTKQTLKKYEVQAIEFSWLFEPVPRITFLKALADSPDLEIYSQDIVNIILMFLWGYYRIVIALFVLLPFFIYFVAFILYANWIHFYKEDESSKTGPYHQANIAMIVIIFTGIGINAILEFYKFLASKLDYFLSFWNLLSFSSLVLNTFIVIADLSRLKESDFIPVLAVAVLLMWFKLFYFGRVFLSTAWIVRMIYSIIIEIAYFLVIFALIIFGFANTFYILARIDNLTYSSDNFLRAIPLSYLNGLGSYEYISDSDYPTEGWNTVFSYLIWILSTFLIFLVLLNMLISIVSDVFSKVNEKAHNNLLKELTQLMIDNNWIFRKLPFFRDTKYIITFTKEKGESDESDEKSRIAAMKKQIEKAVMTDVIDETYADLIDILASKTEQRGVLMSSAIQQQLVSVQEKLEQLESKQTEYENLISVDLPNLKGKSVAGYDIY